MIARSLFLAMLTACGGGGGASFSSYSQADLSDARVVEDYAQAVSAPKAYMLGVMMTMALMQDEPSCPTLTETEDEQIIEGGCTDEDGATWQGRVVVQQSGEDSGSIDYDGFGYTREHACDDTTLVERQIFRGGVDIDPDGGFEIDLSGEGAGVDSERCVSEDFDFDLEYQGTQVDAGSRTTWNGSGTYANSLDGKVDVQTEDEVIDDEACDSEAASGTTTLRAGGHEAVITYDGAIDCDPESTVTWTLNGEDQGELSGVECGPSLPPALWPAGLLGLLALRRRRR